MKVVSGKPIPMAVARKILEKYRDKELLYEQKLAIEHLTKFTKMQDDKKALEMFNEIKETFKVPDEIAVQIVDLMPETTDDVRAILAMLKFSLKEEEIKKIVEIVKKYKE